MTRVTPAPDRSREARPGSSQSIRSLDESRGGAPEGERAFAKPASAPAHVRMATFGCAARTLAGAPFGAPPPPLFVREAFVSLFDKARAQKMRRENGSVLSAPAKRGMGTARSAVEG